MSRAARRRFGRALPVAVVETRGAGWVRIGARVCRLVRPARLAAWVMNRVFLPRFQYRTRFGHRTSRWAPVSSHFRLTAGGER